MKPILMIMCTGGAQGRMPALTRRRDPEARQETWLVYYGDVQSESIFPLST